MLRCHQLEHNWDRLNPRSRWHSGACPQPCSAPQACHPGHCQCPFGSLATPGFPAALLSSTVFPKARADLGLRSWEMAGGMRQGDGGRAGGAQRAFPSAHGPQHSLHLQSLAPSILEPPQQKPPLCRPKKAEAPVPICGWGSWGRRKLPGDTCPEAAAWRDWKGWAGGGGIHGRHQSPLRVDSRPLPAHSLCQLTDELFSSVAQSCLTLCDPMDCSTPGLPVHHQLPEFTQTHVLGVGDAIQPSHRLSSPSPPAFNLSQHQGLFQWVGSSHQVAKGLEFPLQHQSLQWTFRTLSIQDSNEYSELLKEIKPVGKEVDCGPKEDIKAAC